MRLLAKLTIIIAANALAIWAAATYIEGISFIGGTRELAVAAVILAALNLFLKPLLKLFLGPIIIITLGLGLILVNSIVIYLLDLLSKNLMIDGIMALLYATLLISLVNFVVHAATKK